MPPKGTTIFERHIYEPGKPLPLQMRDLLRDPVLVRSLGSDDPDEAVIVRRVSSSPADPIDSSTEVAELWTTDNAGHVVERLSIRCHCCGWRFNLHYLRLWRRKHRKKSGVPVGYCSTGCTSRKQRLPDKQHREKRYREFADRDGSV